MASLFAQAVAVEESDPVAAIPLYKRAIAADENAAESHVNIGTILFNQHAHVNAEKHYRAALAIDSEYSLAWFDLGNVLDERGKPDEAIAAYLKAVTLSPTYADAWYNLAGTYHAQGQHGKAAHANNKYIKLDGNSAWGKHARQRNKQLIARSGLYVVSSNPAPAREPGRAKLELIA